MTLSVPEKWTEDEVKTRMNVREQAPAFKDGSLSAAEESALESGWGSLEDVMLYLLRSHGSDPEAQKAVGSLYEAAFHFTAFIAPENETGTDAEGHV